MAIGGKTGQETNTLYPFRVSHPHRHHDRNKVPCLFHTGTGSDSGVILIPRLPPASAAESRKRSCSAHRGGSPATMPAPAGEARSWQGLSWAPKPFCLPQREAVLRACVQVTELPSAHRSHTGEGLEIPSPISRESPSFPGARVRVRVRVM